MRMHDYRVTFTTEIDGIRLTTSEVVQGISVSDARAMFLRGTTYDHVQVLDVNRLGDYKNAA